MFYSHEVLTSRKYGVATVWLVATLGSKSTLKKVSRRAILDVDVTKACETIVQPEAPFALRLQSNLLYGVSRVYLQQCGYVLADAQSARMAMRSMLRSIRVAELDAEGANKARPDQLVLEDDPNFLPDLDFMPLSLENIDFDRSINDSQSNLSLRDSSQLLTGSEQSIGGLMLPPSRSSLMPGPVGGMDLLSVRGDSGPGKKLNTPRLLEDDISLMLDDDYIGQDESVRQPSAPFGQVDHTAAAGDRGGLPLQRNRRSEDPVFASIDDDVPMGFQDDAVPLPPDDTTVSQRKNSVLVVEQETTSESAAASIARRKRAPKTLPLDNETTHSNRVLARWNEEYLERMREGILTKQGYKCTSLAKKNAEHWVLGQGKSLHQELCSGLDIFTGAALIAAFTGIDLLKCGVGKRKRDATDIDRNDEAPDDNRRVRPRRGPLSNEIARGDQNPGFLDGILPDDGYMPMLYDDTIEQGRDAPTPLTDQHISSMLPWNQSAGSRRLTDAHATSNSISGPGGIQLNPLSRHRRRGSRLTSASPLIGRGAPGPPFGPMDEGNTDNENLQLPGSDTNMGGMTGDDDDEEEFELYGPAAQVDTQTAAQSQWQRSTLGSESANFLDFVRAAIAEREEDEGLVRASIDLDVLLPPGENSQIVAAQAMLHVLALGTTSFLRVEQQEAFGPISLGMTVL